MAKEKIVIKVPASKPRNPYALLARMRRAGAHEKSTKSQRQQHRQRFQTALGSLLDGDLSEFEIE